MKIFKRRKTEAFLDFIRRVIRYADNCETGYSTIEWKPDYFHAEKAQVKP